MPQRVFELLADLRSHLQERVEPREYVSDRRLVKAVQMLQVRSPGAFESIGECLFVCVRENVCVCVHVHHDHRDLAWSHHPR